MADVHLASTTGPAGFTKLVVIKTLREDLAEDRTFVEMFYSEARLAARLQHPNVVQTYEVGEQGGCPYLAMEYLQGQPLHRVLARLGNAPNVDRARNLRLQLRVISDTLSGLHYAHELVDYDGTPLHVVHRDVSPQNVFVTYTGHVKLVDFGIAKMAGMGVDTRSGVVKGKPSYMAPEQVTAGKIDRRADIYAMGVMLWEALMGRRMWEGASELSVLGKLSLGQLPKLDEVAVPSAHLRAICEKALQHDPEARFASADAMRSSLLLATSEQPHASIDEVGALVSRAFISEQSEIQQLIRQRALASQAQPGRAGETLNSHTQSIPAAYEMSRDARHDVTIAQPSSRPLPKLQAATGRARVNWLASALLGASAVLVAVIVFTGNTPRGSDQDRESPARKATASPLAPDPIACKRTDKPRVAISGDIDEDATLSCENDYLLTYHVVVRSGVSLTIAPGTTLQGDHTTMAALVVEPGGRLVAAGNPDAPIVFTSSKSPDERRAGDWGGVVVLGNAPTNVPGDAAGVARGQVEGLTQGGEYGGSLPHDDSGVLSYVRIEYAGHAIAPGNELNGLTLAGVGDGTRIDHVQVRHTADDCFEFFGGTVNAKYLICYAARDDAFDWDFGYRGKLQFLLLSQAEDAAANSNGFEGDNDPSGSSNEPRSNPTIYNATLCGRATGTARERYGLLARRSTRLSLHNSVIQGFDVGFDVRDRATRIDLGGVTLFGNGAANIAEAEQGASGANADDDGAFDEVAWFNAPEHHNTTADPKLEGCADLAQTSFAPSSVLRAPQTPPDDGFFDTTANYVGAVRDADDTWPTAPWVVWGK